MQHQRQLRDVRPGEIEADLAIAGLVFKTEGNEIRVSKCADCGYEKQGNWSVKIVKEKTSEKPVGFWYCYHCTHGSHYFDFAEKLGIHKPDKWVENEAYKFDIDLAKVFMLPKTRRRPVTGGHYAELLQYCLDRGISKETLDAYRVSSKGAGMLRFPIYQDRNNGCGETFDWQMVNAKIRPVKDLAHSSSKEFFEVRGCPTNLLIGNHLFDPTHERVLIFEGPWDAMTAYEMGFRNCFSVPNGTAHIKVADMLRYVPEHFEKWICMDADEAGKRAVEKFFSQLGSDKVKVMQIGEHQDLNDWKQSNPTLSAKDVEKSVCGITNVVSFCKEKSKVYDDFIDLDMSEKEEKDMVTQVSDTPWPTLNKRLAGGWRETEWTGILAPSGVGKTTIVNQSGVHAAFSGAKVGIISIEGSENDFKCNLKQCIRQYPQELQQATARNIHPSKLRGHKTPWRDCYDQFRTFIDKGCKLLVMDNLDCITRGDSSQKLQAVADITDLCVSASVHIICVFQPNQVDRHAVVNSGNMKGYSQMLADSFNYINLNHQLDGEKTLTMLEIEKSRRHGVNAGLNPLDNKVYLEYQPGYRSYKEVSYQGKPNNSGQVIPIASMM